AAPRGVRMIRVVTAAEMAMAARRAFGRCDAAIFTAAVCDYRPARRAARKSAKTGRPLMVRLEPTEGIAASLGAMKGRRLTIGLAMEDHAGRAHARQKLLRKHCDAIVLNGPENVGGDRARVDYLEARDRWQRWPPASKAAVARRLVARLERLARFHAK